MILRSLTLAGGIAGAAAVSQFPEFSQQYAQRLGGAVDALAEVVADFDASAAAVGLERETALAQMQGSAFLERRQADMTRTFTRFERLRVDLAALEGQGPFMRAYHLPRLRDAEIARAAWVAYQPAVPLNFAGVSFALVGFLLGAAALGGVLKLLFWPFRRRSNPA
ncbi:DUF2937 family protein [Sulfitobacter sp. M57]|uniref:DUF2937 family protein n=1 Tax=unclassified Sulfitobacter TaxID=196795 RepID=UPI0023E1D973|nr:MULTISPECIES: DUF2937 family protein [unclassified Sulfitobacter]MDF3414285.1 DUF2937 family protein [Sulfitobacter sp. KE5]MDF3420433.1 DUF2937 family protein [Sulfitobacter sp. KE43]MDF3432831.1 DUF2937 family protein [Sulfitobacter sp. KE42]MDF3458471.1 DUF2937 family protein [Sulfitobacter sp. S74]MDF3462371.1 DUF2937 family protein [Sulfitobacter sp. Ks18]